MDVLASIYQRIDTLSLICAYHSVTYILVKHVYPYLHISLLTCRTSFFNIQLIALVQVLDALWRLGSFMPPSFKDTSSWNLATINKKKYLTERLHASYLNWLRILQRNVCGNRIRGFGNYEIKVQVSVKLKKKKKHFLLTNNEFH